MAEVTPFRAVRYTGAAGDLADLVAPPYDAVDDEERARLYTRSPYNVVHVTLPESAAAAGRLYRDWLASGILARDDDEAMWLAAERYVGPDGVERERHGVIGSVAAEPYATGGVLPHERTHARIRDGAARAPARDSRAARAAPAARRRDARAVDPGAGARPRSRRDAALAQRRERGDRRGRAAGRRRPPSLRERRRARTRARRLVAHHGARRLRRRRGPRTSSRPTASSWGGPISRSSRGESGSRISTRGWLRSTREPRDRSAALVYRPGRVELVRGSEGDLDAALVDRHGLDGIGYTSSAREAAAAVDRGDADVAFVVRAPLVDDAFAVARRGERMPAKSTYFTPKPLSGLVFHPLER